MSIIICCSMNPFAANFFFMKLHDAVICCCAILWKCKQIIKLKMYAHFSHVSVVRNLPLKARFVIADIGRMSSSLTTPMINDLKLLVPQKSQSHQEPLEISFFNQSRISLSRKKSSSIPFRTSSTSGFPRLNNTNVIVVAEKIFLRTKPYDGCEEMETKEQTPLICILHHLSCHFLRQQRWRHESFRDESLQICIEFSTCRFKTNNHRKYSNSFWERRKRWHDTMA